MSLNGNFKTLINATEANFSEQNSTFNVYNPSLLSPFESGPPPTQARNTWTFFLTRTKLFPDFGKIFPDDKPNAIGVPTYIIL